VFYGDSYCYACQTRELLRLDTTCVGIDSWEGDASMGAYGEGVYADLVAHHDPLYGAFSTLRRSRFESECPTFADGSIDILHIDGEHTYEAVSRDFHSWRPKVARGGIVLFHDSAVDDPSFGVRRLWSEISSGVPSFEFTHGNGLGVLLHGTSADAPDALRRLFGASVDETAAIRRFFELLGTPYVSLAGGRRVPAGAAAIPALDPRTVPLSDHLEEQKRVFKMLSRSRWRKLRYVLSGRL
jgi:hypothetical protein